jgi:hypothetical protein
MIRDRMIGGALVEAMLTLWASSSRDAKQRIAVYTRAGRSLGAAISRRIVRQ